MEKGPVNRPTSTSIQIGSGVSSAVAALSEGVRFVNLIFLVLRKPIFLRSLPSTATPTSLPSNSTSLPTPTSVRTIPSTVTPTSLPSTATAIPDTPKHAHTLSAGPIAGAVIGSILVLVIGISVSIRVFRRQRGRRHQQLEAGLVSPLQPTALADANLTTILTLDPSGEKSHHNRDSGILPVPNTSAWQAESTSEFPHPDLPPNISSESHLFPSSTQTQDASDMRAQVVQMGVAMGRMAEQIRHLESQLVMTGDGDSYTPPPTYISS
ncbi:hypothetical protein BDP27DRAFT_1437391 [Rhodocollybia butyracea]|uniref:Transmembrane protein n=1 Tax=Rhodocollybia butyracea TaxID=206335 RepID=A0A9P5P0Q4_9AGAR|nr:hypothetical protein BDP27DRAFT_1437391 [Rhodocollybia butyracea]